MILFINGPFGVGKTTVARLLVQIVRKMPRAMLYDPEVVGAVLRTIVGPFKQVKDYQDCGLWRRLVVGGARLLRAVSGRTLVIPMTVYRRNAFDPIVAGLRRADPDLSCFRLTAPQDVLMDRISSDTGAREACSWQTSHVGVCLKALCDPAFGTGIRTEGLASAAVADQILRNLPVTTGRSRS
jgi:hypothetical protein